MKDENWVQAHLSPEGGYQSLKTFIEACMDLEQYENESREHWKPKKTEEDQSLKYPCSSALDLTVLSSMTPYVGG